MFMNENTHTYFYPTGSKAVVLECRKDLLRGPEATAVVGAEMLRFIDNVRVKRPAWKFKSDENVYNTDQKLNTFDVYDGDEKLGRLWIEKHWRTLEIQYCFNNHRLSDKRQRGRANFSTKVDVATKKVIGSFGALSPDEQAIRAYASIRNVAAKESSSANYEYSRRERQVANALMFHIISNWETLRQYAGDMKDTNLPGLYAKQKEMSAVWDAVDKRGGVVLLIHGERFIRQRDNEEAAVIGWGDLTEKQRASLGMLKLMEDGAVVPTIGVRVDATTFFLID